jgi:hypothetical protein
VLQALINGMQELQKKLREQRPTGLQTLCTIRSETQLMEQLDYNLLYRWFVGPGRMSRMTRLQCGSSAARAWRGWG